MQLSTELHGVLAFDPGKIVVELGHLGTHGSYGVVPEVSKARSTAEIEPREGTRSTGCLLYTSHPPCPGRAGHPEPLVRDSPARSRRLRPWAAVSYTHLDVYKRQTLGGAHGPASATNENRIPGRNLHPRLLLPCG